MAVTMAMAAGSHAPAWGAGLGRLTVQSALGQPLVAEVEINSLSPDELRSLSAKLAPPEAFRQAGLDFRPALSTLRFSIDRANDGRVFVRIRSTQAVNEPFVDLLIELNWAAGKFVREYTFLLDPPELRVGRDTVEGHLATPRLARAVAGDVSKVGDATAADAAGGRAAASGAAMRGSYAPGGAAAGGSSAPRGATGGTSAPGTAVQPSSGPVTVRRGEALGSIAARVAPAGVAREQAMMAIYNANPQAFFGGVHRMYAGRTLAIPDVAAMQALDAAEARRQIQAQTSDYNAYRERLAAAARREDAAAPALAPSPSPSADGLHAAGKSDGSTNAESAESAQSSSVQSAESSSVRSAAPQAPASVPPAADQLRLSGAAPIAGDAVAPAPESTLAAEARVAEAAALREQGARVAALEKNVADLHALLQLKSRELAELQRQVEAVRDASPGTDSPGQAMVGDTAASGAPSPSRDVAAAPAALAAGGTANAPTAADASASKAASPPARAAASSGLSPDRERGFVDELIASPLTVPGLAALLVALGAYGWYTLRRRKSEHFEDSLIAANAFTANSLFGTTGGQAVDTSNQGLFGIGVQQTAADVHATEVDPIAEAEVYIAYGRESQAEEILREALDRQPERQAIRLKLLEIHAARKDIEAFGHVAQEMYDMGVGQNEEWARAAALGRSIDPANPLYSGAEEPAMADPDARQAHSLSGFGLPDEQMEPFDTSAPLADLVSSGPSFPDGSGRLDASPSMAASWPEVGAFTSDFAETRPAGAPGAARKTSVFDFSLDIDAPIARRATQDATTDEVASDRSELERAVAHARFELPSLDFDVAPVGESLISDLPAVPDSDPFSAETAKPQEPGAGRIERASLFADLGDFRIDLPPLEDLDLKRARHDATFETDGAMIALARLDVVAAEDTTAQWQEMATKLDLASAYEEIGDKEGARELLEEVVLAGDAGQKHCAEAMLSKIG